MVDGDHHMDDKGPGRPSQTKRGLPRVDMTSEANMVLSGSSPRKMIGKTASDDGEVHDDLSRRAKVPPSFRP